MVRMRDSRDPRRAHAPQTHPQGEIRGGAGQVRHSRRSKVTDMRDGKHHATGNTRDFDTIGRIASRAGVFPGFLGDAIAALDRAVGECNVKLGQKTVAHERNIDRPQGGSDGCGMKAS